VKGQVQPPPVQPPTQPRPSDPRPIPPVPPQPTVPQPPPQPPAEVKAPISDEDYAKNAVKDVLKQLCAAYEALDPDAAQQAFPKVNMAVLRLQLNKSQYKSVACTFTEPTLTFLALDPAAGTARIRVEVKRVFEHASLDQKPDVSEQIASMTFSRASQRGRWVIETAEYRPKPKEK
jgi:hypothetical protein